MYQILICTENQNICKLTKIFFLNSAYKYMYLQSELQAFKISKTAAILVHFFGKLQISVAKKKKKTFFFVQ